MLILTTGGLFVTSLASTFHLYSYTQKLGRLSYALRSISCCDLIFGAASRLLMAGALPSQLFRSSRCGSSHCTGIPRQIQSPSFQSSFKSSHDCKTSFRSSIHRSPPNSRVIPPIYRAPPAHPKIMLTSYWYSAGISHLESSPGGQRPI